MVKTDDQWRELLRLIPGYDPFWHSDGYWFDPERAIRVCEFFSECLTHSIGGHAGNAFELQDWQEAVAANLFGWVDNKTGWRRYRETLIYVPRKNGKTTLAAGFALYLLMCDGEAGAHVYSAAADVDQAKLVFDTAVGMVRGCSELSSRLKEFARSFVCKESLSAWKVLTSAPKSKHGLNAHGVIIDELHAQETPKLVDALVTAVASRDQSLVVMMTTADHVGESVCNDKYRYACDIRDQTLEDPRFLPVIHEALRADDWKDPKTWAKANPNLGVSVQMDYMRSACLRAQQAPAFQNTFQQLHLNVQTELADAWISVEQWRECYDPSFNVERLRGRDCYGGLDLATSSDMTAIVLLFPDDDGGFDLLPFFWMPLDEVNNPAGKNFARYQQWHREGHIIVTEGSPVLNYDTLRRDISGGGTGVPTFSEPLEHRYNIRELAVDAWHQGHQLLGNLTGDRMRAFPVGQGMKAFAPPTKAFFDLVLRGAIRHDGNPVLAWMLGNVRIISDDAENWRPSKRHSAGKIDGIAAALMALGRAMLKGGESVYQTKRPEGIIRL